MECIICCEAIERRTLAIPSCRTCKVTYHIDCYNKMKETNEISCAVCRKKTYTETVIDNESEYLRFFGSRYTNNSSTRSVPYTMEIRPSAGGVEQFIDFIYRRPSPTVFPVATQSFDMYRTTNSDYGRFIGGGVH